MTIRIFLADDHGILRAGLRLLLESQADMTVVGEASNGRDAVQQVLQLQPDIVILDVSLPELNGIEATRQIRAVYPKMQIIILSAYMSNEYIYQALNAGAQGYVLKSASSTELIEATHLVFAGERHLSRKISDELINDYLIQRTSIEKEKPLAQLQARDREIIQLIAEGKSSAMIAEIMGFSTKTVETYRSRIMQRLGFTDLPSLIKFAILHGLTPLE